MGREKKKKKRKNVKAFLVSYYEGFQLQTIQTDFHMKLSHFTHKTRNSQFGAEIIYVHPDSDAEICYNFSSLLNVVRKLHESQTS